MLNETLEKYLKFFPKDGPALGLLLEQITAGDELNDRQNWKGHITAGGIILSPDYRKVLMIYYPSANRWQQPGGHWEPDEEGPWSAAQRESVEETGFKLAKRISVSDDLRVPLSIDSHLVPSVGSKNEPEHYHHDFRYGFIAKSEKLELNDKVIQEAKWVALEAPEADLIRKELTRLLPLV
jgi:8-oxo-dGTP pyrophosphatase MutT (NUDIX family)